VQMDWMWQRRCLGSINDDIDPFIGIGKRVDEVAVSWNAGVLHDVKKSRIAILREESVSMQRPFEQGGIVCRDCNIHRGFSNVCGAGVDCNRRNEVRERLIYTSCGVVLPCACGIGGKPGVGEDSSDLITLNGSRAGLVVEAEPV
jgi:hypothetical protein